jgi:hypothetical protein
VVGEVEVLCQELWDLAQLQHGGQFLQTDVQGGAQLVEVDSGGRGGGQHVPGLRALALVHALHLDQEAVGAKTPPSTRSTQLSLNKGLASLSCFSPQQMNLKISYLVIFFMISRLVFVNIFFIPKKYAFL